MSISDSARVKNERQALGICRRCPANAAPNRRLCDKCLAMQNEYRRIKYRKRKQLGLCVWGGCKSQPAEGRTFCAAHAALLVDYNRRYYKRHLAVYRLQRRNCR